MLLFNYNTVNATLQNTYKGVERIVLYVYDVTVKTPDIDHVVPVVVIGGLAVHERCLVLHGERLLWFDRNPDATLSQQFNNMP